MQPRQGYAGTRITLRGELMGRVDSVLLGNTRLAIVSRKPGRIVAEIPAGASDGWVSLVVFGKVRRTDYQFKMLRGPEFVDFSPRSGRPGTEVSITGRHFNKRTTAYWGQSQIKVMSWSKRQLVVRLPDDAIPGRAFLSVRSDGQLSRARSKFRVVPGPRITGVSSSWVYEGAKFSINGELFASGARLYWGDVELQIASTSRGGRVIQAYAPRGTYGKRFLWVEDDQGRYRSQNKLEIRPVKTRDHRKKRRGGGY